MDKSGMHRGRSLLGVSEGMATRQSDGSSMLLPEAWWRGDGRSEGDGQAIALCIAEGGAATAAYG